MADRSAAYTARNSGKDVPRRRIDDDNNDMKRKKKWGEGRVFKRMININVNDKDLVCSSEELHTLLVHHS